MAGSWDKPPRVQVQINKAMVAQILGANTPVGKHEHDDRHWAYGKHSATGNRSRRTIKGKETGGWPRKSGRLRDFISHIPNWHMKNKGQACYISIFLPYVRALNWGADIPAVNFREATNRGMRLRAGEKGYKSQRFERSRQDSSYWLMHWSNGDSVFRSQRSGYHIAAQHFLEKGVQEWAAKAGGLEVSWAKGTDTA